MPFSEKGSNGSTEDAEALVNKLTIGNASLGQSSLSGLSNTDFRTLTELSQELTLDTEEMETEEMIVESQEEVEHEEEVDQTEIEPQEIEVEAEEAQNAEQQNAIQDVRTSRATILPALRPLTIAPKPKHIPIAMKPVGGQPLLFLQGSTGTGQAIKLVSSQGQEQAIKLVSPQGQELNLSNIQLGRPVTIKPTIKTITTSQAGNMGNIIVQQKPLVMKKIVTISPGQKTISKPIALNKQGQQLMVVQKAGEQQQIKLIQTAPSNVATIGNTHKTLTLQQAHDMGLLTNAKIVTQSQPTGKQTVMVNKPQSKMIKLVPQSGTTQIVSAAGKTITLNQVKSPTKILPATSITGNTLHKVPQRIILKTAGNTQTVLPAGQFIQVSGSHPGQIHQINIPGKGMNYIVTSSALDTNSIVASENSSITTSNNSSSSSITSSPPDIKPIMTNSKIAPKPLVVKSTLNKMPITSNPTPMMILSSVATPTTQSTITQNAKVPIPPIKSNLSPVVKTEVSSTTAMDTTTSTVDPNGIRPRKACNCNKSQCLKLYCDCFANGEFCYMCNCMNCFNNLENEEHRNRAIKACLERNPYAFRPKIGKAKDVSGEVAVRKHTKGCNCKRSGCLKNYCECYEAKIACSSNCKCFGCRNIEDSMDKKNVRLGPHMDDETSVIPEKLFRRLLPVKDEVPPKQRRMSGSRKQTINFITDDVIEAACQCLLTASDNSDIMEDDEMVKRKIIEEFGRCLTEIISCSSNRSLS